MQTDRLVTKSVLWGMTAGTILMALYFIILSLSNSLQHAVEELGALWIWIAPLVIGFSVQAGLYSYIRGAMKRRTDMAATASVAAAGGTSTTAMVACCMHHVTDILPIVGASAAALFLTRYQTVFMALGVASNLVGIIMMLRIIQRNGLYDRSNPFLSRVLALDMSRTFYVALLLGAVFVGSVFVGV